MHYLFLAIALTGCRAHYGQSQFTTRCGVTYRGDAHGDKSLERAEFDLQELQDNEDLAIGYGLVTCEQLQGYSVYTNPDMWKSTSGSIVLGEAYCNQLFEPYVVISLNAPHVLLHEFHHVAQGCNPPVLVDPGLESTHSNWNRSGAHERIMRGNQYMYMIHHDKHTPGVPLVEEDPSPYAPTAGDKEKAE